MFDSGGGGRGIFLRASEGELRSVFRAQFLSILLKEALQSNFCEVRDHPQPL